MKKCTLTILPIVMFFVVSVFCFSACSSTEETELPAIEGVYATDISVVYDGRPHAGGVKNAQPLDTVLYSVDNSAWTASAPSFVLPGTYTVRYSVSRTGYIDLISSYTVTIERCVLENISAPDKYVVYDGKPHNIDIVGLSTTDSVAYSIDGINFGPTLGCTEVGQYTIYYRVNGSYGDYADSSTLFILPEIDGVYINAEHGAIILTGSTCIYGDKEYPMNYDVSAKGIINYIEPFFVKNGSFFAKNIEFSRISSDDRIYCVNGHYCCSPGENLNLDIYFANNRASIIISDSEIFGVDNVNYCDDGNYTDYDMSRCSVAIFPSAFITYADLTFSLLPVLSDPPLLRIIYDGQPHSFSYDGAELLFDGTTPSFVEVGAYSAVAVIIKDGYLPLKTTVFLDIIPDIYGKYYNSDTTLSINADGAVIGGNAVACEFSDGHWLIDGHTVTVNDGSIAFNGVTFYKTTKILLYFDFGGEHAIKEYNYSNNTFITVNKTDGGFSVNIPDYFDSDVFISADELALFINGESWYEIEIDENSTLYVLSNSDIINFGKDVIYIVFS